MTRALELRATQCAICDTANNAVELYPARFGAEAFNPIIFSARRMPDRVHYRFVRCNSCGLTRADPVADSAALAELYAESGFDYNDEVPNLKATYGDYLDGLKQFGVDKAALLEIGCGNGFLLQEALARGFARVQGVEPSDAAIARAHVDVRRFIRRGVMRPGLFAAEQFTVICLFQVLDHIPNPRELLDECWALLRPGGLMLCLNHNIDALSSRLLRERSPIVDIEHTYLYTPATIARLFAGSGFAVRHVAAARNTYTIGYFARLLPLPTPLKRLLLEAIKRSGIGRLRMSIPIGNLYLVAQKPAV